MRVKIFQLLEKWRKYIYMEELQKLLNNHPEVHVKKFYNLKWVLVVFCSKQYTRVSKRNCYTVSYARSPKQLNADHDFAQFFFLHLDSVIYAVVKKLKCLPLEASFDLTTEALHIIRKLPSSVEVEEEISLIKIECINEKCMF